MHLILDGTDWKDRETANLTQTWGIHTRLCHSLVKLIAVWHLGKNRISRKHMHTLVKAVSDLHNLDENPWHMHIMPGPAFH